MTANIANADRFVHYTPNNSTGPFPVPFPVFDPTGADLEVTLNGQVVTSGWSFTGTLEPGFYGAPNTWVNGSISFDAPISGSLYIEGNRAPRRPAEAQFAEGRGIPARDHNTEYNTLTAICREIWQRLKRTVRVPLGEAGVTLPPLSARAGKYLGFDGAGNPVPLQPNQVNTPDLSDGAVTDPKVFDPPSPSHPDAVRASKLSFLQAGTDAVYRTVQDKLRERVSVKDFGVTSSGDQYIRYQNACNELSSLGGGTLVIPHDVNSVIDGILNIPDNVVLEYEGGLVGHIDPKNILNRQGKIILPSGARITLNNGSGLRGLVIIRDGISFTSSSAQVAAWATNGDAVVINNLTTDAFVEDCGIFGFAQAIRSAVGATNVSRTRLRRLQIDCVSGVLLEYAYDIPYVEEVHCWPFCSVGAPGEPSGAHLLRAGTAFYFGAVNDWMKVLNCFNYGYFCGFRIKGGGNITLISCGSDYVPDQISDGSIGFLIDGQSTETTLIACQAAARHVGFYVNTTSPHGTVSMQGCSSWECDDAHILLEKGRALIQGHRARGGNSNGVLVYAGFEKAVIVGNDFKELNVGIYQQSSTTKVYEKLNTYTNVATRKANLYKATVAVADPLPLDGESESFEITGTGGFGNINNPQDYTGKTLVLKFTDTVTVHSGGNMKLKDNTNFVAGADDILVLYSDGSFFYEVSRSTN